MSGSEGADGVPTPAPPRSWAVRLASIPIQLYRATAPMRSPRCRFAPSCSSYALEAIRVHGAARGGWLALRRIGRCHPWNPGGVDHVPPRAGSDGTRHLERSSHSYRETDQTPRK